MNDKQKRIMWCKKCDIPTNHIIDYKGTKIREGTVYAKFYSVCIRCQCRKRSEIIENFIPLEDYNALMNKEIYA